jgi:hypothetical protein
MTSLDRNYIPFEDVEPIYVELKEPDDFLKIRETISRIGLLSRHSNVLYQSCHILHSRRGTLSPYRICHFKELFGLDGKQTTITLDDLARRSTTARLLEQWGLLTILNPEVLDKYGYCPLNKIKVVSYKEKVEGVYKLEPKYTIGNKGPRKQEEPGG